MMMKRLGWVIFLVGLMLMGCGGDTAVSTPYPTPEPIDTVVEAILTANRGEFAQADRLLDVTAVANEAEYEATQPYWLWLTSDQRVSNVDIEIEETDGDALHLFVVLDNEDRPRQQTRFWIRWNGTQWETFIYE